MSRNTYITPEKTSVHHNHSHYRKYDLTPPTVEPKYSHHQSKHYCDGSCEHTPHYKRLAYDRSPIRTNRIKTQVSYEDQYTNRAKLYERRDNYFKMSESELKEILMSYEYQITALKDYIHESQVLERKRIIDIFGFSYSNYYHENGDKCDCCIKSAESKTMIKELSSKVSDLLRENQRLHSQEKQRINKVNQQAQIRKEVEDQRLLRQNRRLQAIIQEYKRNEQQNLGKQHVHQEHITRIRQLEQYIHKLEQNDRTRSINNDQQYKNRIGELENHIRGLEQQNQKLIGVIRESDQRLKSLRLSQQNIQENKNQLNQTILQFSHQLQNKYRSLEDKTQKQHYKISELQKQIGAYKKERNLKIDSTIRKSYILSSSMKRPKGDQDQEIINRDEEMNRDIHDSYIKMKGSFQKFEPTSPHLNIQYVDVSNNEKRAYQQRIGILEAQIRDLMQQNRGLQSAVRDRQQKNSQKVAQILQMEQEMQSLRNKTLQVSNNSTIRVIQRQVQNPEIQIQIKRIKQILLSCNTTNYELFFKQFGQIIEQRNLMNNKINEYEMVSSYLQKNRANKQDIDVLNNKINQLTQQNKKLLNKVASLEDQVEKCHSQVLLNQVKKLTESKIFKGESSSGKEAIEWQKIVKSCIENSVARLNAIEGKIGRKQIPMTQSHLVRYREESHPIK